MSKNTFFNALLVMLLFWLILVFAKIDFGLIKYFNDWEKEIRITKDLLTILGILVGAYLAYDRFFRNGAYYENLDIDIYIKKSWEKNKLIQLLKITIQNKGTKVIDFPNCVLNVEEFGFTEKLTTDQIKDFTNPDLEKGNYLTNYIATEKIAPNEKAFLTTTYKPGNDAYYLRYTIYIETKSKKSWQNTIYSFVTNQNNLE